VDFNGGVEEENETKKHIIQIVKKEQNEMFGLFPPKDRPEARYIMVTLEIVRIHLR